MEKSVAIITGASSGIGKVTARVFAQNGYRVFGTSRHPQDDFDGVRMVQLDVTSDESIAECVNKIVQKTGRIDVLVNNAGLAQITSVEETPVDEIMPVYDTNLFGVIRMTQAVLPHMREQKSGHIIGVGSLGGRIALPGSGAYAASKAALAALYGSLRGEVGQFGIKVSVVEPGSFKSEMGQRAIFPQNPMPIYDKVREKFYEGATSAMAKAPEPDAVANKILKIAQSNNPRLRYLVGNDAHMLWTMKSVLPDQLFEGLLKRVLGI
jgi:NAD(P)-dependent dehydrogenase (short-subunit alcohol dehydrogenase family)